MSNLLVHIIVLLVGAIIGGLVVRANSKKALMLLDELAAKAKLGTEEAKIYITEKLKLHK